jgi:hypothetical protein
MVRLFIAVHVIHALSAVYWLFLAIISFMAGRKIQAPSSAPVSMAKPRQMKTDPTHIHTQLLLFLVQILAIIMPTIFIGVYSAIWTGVKALSDLNPAGGLSILADCFNDACNLAAFLGLMITLAKRRTWASPVEGANKAPPEGEQATQPAIFQQPADPAWNAQQHAATPVPGRGTLQAKESEQTHSRILQEIATKGGEIVVQPMPT